MRSAWRDTLVYTGSQGLYYGVPVLLIPVCSRVIPARDLGVLELFVLVGTILSMLASLEIGQGLARFAAGAGEAPARRAYASSAFWLAALGCAVLVAVSLAGADPIATAITGEPGWGPEFVLASVAMSLQCLFVLVQGQLRWQVRPAPFAVTSLVHAAVNIATTLVCLLALRWGLASVLVGQSVAAVGAGAMAWAMSRGSFGWSLSRPALREMLAFALPLVPSSLAVLGSQYLDRLALGQFRPMSEVGVYVVGLRIGSVVNFLLVGLHSALTPLIYRDHALASTPGELAGLFRRFAGIALAGIVVLAAFSRELVGLASPPEYAAAAWLVGPLAASTLLSRLYVFAPGLEIAKRTGWIAGINLAVLAVQGAAMLALVPAHGMRGAALASLLGALTAFGLTLAASQRAYPVPHDYRRLSLAAAIAAVAMFVGVRWRLPVAAAAALAAAATVAILRVLRRDRAPAVHEPPR